MDLKKTQGLRSGREVCKTAYRNPFCVASVTLWSALGMFFAVFGFYLFFALETATLSCTIRWWPGMVWLPSS